ncbi:hypothetical protein [Rufibacter sp. LB8]|uniref:hypothetical protein n=1 Tax=Rufibacter sp. LB8 TaxID=2777781 RepID=UPI00178C26B3|nr:hypothetical protein [Rufibacter sp. LB8]
MLYLIEGERAACSFCTLCLISSAHWIGVILLLLYFLASVFGFISGNEPENGRFCLPNFLLLALPVV